ncbi:hypothetical protein [Salinicoccus albus]|uniref:hypothetical protein n=1 Tax=Salinicoccus albus TaxID=418756 RepID=UPI000365841E|nr:hypothetical protein [Salinicoccus albus]
MNGAPGPHRSTTEVRVKRMITAEIVVHMEDGASAEENNDLIEYQIKQAEKDLNYGSSYFENIKVEDEI